MVSFLFQSNNAYLNVTINTAIAWQATYNPECYSIIDEDLWKESLDIDGRSTFPPRSIKWTITSHLTHWTQKGNTTYDARNPSPELI